LNRWLVKYPDVKLEAESRLAKFAKREAKKQIDNNQETLFN